MHLLILETVFALLCWAILVVVSALPEVALWHYLPKLGTWLGRQRNRFVPWNGWDVAMLFFVCILCWPAMVDGFLRATGFSAHFLASEIDESLAKDQETIWITAVAFPFQLATIFAVVVLKQARPFHFGLSRGNAVRHALLGWAFWLGLTPLVFLVQFLALSVYSPEKHPLARLAEDNPQPAELLLIFLVAVVAAPVLEETLFRGILQPWLTQRLRGGSIVMAACLLLGVLSSWVKLQQTGVTFLEAMQPMFFLLVMIPGCFFMQNVTRRWVGRPEAAGAIYGTALLFAMFHVEVWPTPIPLFVLGLGLGYLAYRTQGILGPIVMHALFNAVAVLGLILGQSPHTPGPAKGNEQTSAWQRPPSASTSKTVPGSWLPRRTYASAIAAPRRGEKAEEPVWPISLLSRNSLAPCAAGVGPDKRSPTSDRLTWP
jgi:membrane protease YdiL (CAAX protease family)